MHDTPMPQVDCQASASVLRELLCTLQGYYAHHRVRETYGIADNNPKIMDDLAELIDLISAWHQEFLEGNFRLMLDGVPQPQDQLVMFAHSLLRSIFIWESNTVASVEKVLEREEPPDYTLLRYLIACYVWPLYRYENRARLGAEYLKRFPEIVLAESGEEAFQIGNEALTVANSLAQEFAEDEANLSPERRAQVLASLSDHLATLYDLMLESLVETAKLIEYDVVAAAMEED